MVVGGWWRGGGVEGWWGGRVGEIRPAIGAVADWCVLCAWHCVGVWVVHCVTPCDTVCVCVAKTSTAVHVFTLLTHSS